jgi:hypothetical protein
MVRDARPSRQVHTDASFNPVVRIRVAGRTWRVSATARKSARPLVAPAVSAVGSLRVGAVVLAVGRDTRYGTHRAEEGDLAEYSLEQSVEESNMDQQQAHCILQMAEGRAWRQSATSRSNV